MRNAIKSIILFSVLINLQGFSQSPLTYEKLKGTWVMNLDIHEEIKKQSEPDNAFEQAVLNGVSGFVETLTNALNIKLTFKANNEVIITTQYDKGKVEVKKGNYTVNKKGQLNFTSESESSTSSDIWILDGEKIYLRNEDGSLNRNVFLSKIREK